MRSAGRRSPGATAAVLAVLAAVSCGHAADAPTTAPAAPTAKPATFVIRARAVYPCTAEQPGPIERGVVFVRDGRIAAVGRDVTVPADVPVIELRDAVICPGFVSAAGPYAGPHTGRESVSGAYRAADAFDRYGDFSLALSAGITTAHVDPGRHRLLTGLGAVVRLGGPAERRVLVPAADVSVTLGVFGPPQVFEPPFYASSDVPIEPARGQRPDSRLGQILELEEQIAAIDARAVPAKFDLHTLALAEAWAADLPLRIDVRRAADVEAALAFVARHQRLAYLVGLTEGEELPAELLKADLPLVVRIEESYRRPGSDIGADPEAMVPSITTPARLLAAAPGLAGRMALAGGSDYREDLRLAAILAVRGGLDPQQALAGITRIPAEIMGVGRQVGSLAPGRAADFVVLTDEPLELSSWVQRTYIDGQVVFDAAARGLPRPVAAAPTSQPTSQPAGLPPPPPLVVRAGTVWVGNGTVLRDAEVLLEDGKVREVGQRVAHPPFARTIDAGPGGFLAPGFIDAHGHLGLQRDTSPATPDLPPHQAIGAADATFARVARAGVTTVVLAPYRAAPNGARMAALKTWGRDRDELVARELTGVRFALPSPDPLGAMEPLRRALQAGQKYVESWKKYEEELAKWKAGGPSAKPAEAETTVERKTDPITGRWEMTVSGDPLPEPVQGTMTLKLTGDVIEGRITDPMSGEEATLTGTLKGNEVTLEVDVDTPLGKPRIVATLDREDHMAGKAHVGEFSVSFEASRTDKSAVEFKVQRRRRAKDGRPAPPKIDENLEPYRALLAGRVPAVVDAETAAQVNALIKLFVEEFKVPLVLLNAPGATDAAEPLLAHRDQVGIVVPREPVAPQQAGVPVSFPRARTPYNAAADLSRRGVRVALQSGAEDGARTLPLVGLYAVREGLGGDAALRALTVDAAKMYKLDDRVGTLEPGKDADVLVFTGHPFDAGSRLERVLVGGLEVPGEGTE